ncbi:uncharacterized protein LOC131146805 [Malania oleifera]|uniref:uncharacterized protein LOC131146805 n=1 Tax=Malania oleifera TaxID=397392 RepID=UPI0025AECC5A|nr:uncharacterized protein LOC131146805 [Malania oleifera]
MSAELGASTNPRKWRFTWEALSHNPTLRLLLFDSHTKPADQCKNLSVDLNIQQSLLLVSWLEDVQVSLSVPIPKVLVDVESPISFRALEDHIEVKLVLLLPVDHPIVSNFDSLLNNLSAYNSQGEDELSNESLPLSLDSDLKSLTSKGGVHFHCRNCSTKLTKRPIRIFSETPSVNWREVADNWFGACCCSFGGISEKLVTRYADLYKCEESMCLLNNTSVLLSKDDLLECKFADWDKVTKYESEPCPPIDNGPVEAARVSGGNHGTAECYDNDFAGESCFLHHKKEIPAENAVCEVSEKEIIVDNLSCTFTETEFSKNMVPAQCCIDMMNLVVDHGSKICTHVTPEFLEEQELKKTTELPENQRSFLNGFLGNIFMARASNISKDIQWIEYFCPWCSFSLGAYPCVNGNAPLDGGVRLFKCNISTCFPVGGSDDIFRKYTLERMFAYQLLESAKDELSFRTVISDLKTKSPMIQVVLVNADSWCCSGYALCAEGNMEPLPKINLHPIIKVLFSDCSNNVESQSRLIEEWVMKNLADEVYMLTHQIKELVVSLDSGRNIYPPSYGFLQGLALSYIQR